MREAKKRVPNSKSNSSKGNVSPSKEPAKKAQQEANAPAGSRSSKKSQRAQRSGDGEAESKNAATKAQNAHSKGKRNAGANVAPGKKAKNSKNYSKGVDGAKAVASSMTNVANMMDDSNVNAPSHVQVSISKADAAGKSDEKNASENGGAKDVDGDSAQERGTSKSSDAETTVGTISGDLESCVRTFYSRLNDWLVGNVEKNMDEFSKVDKLLDENFEDHDLGILDR